MNEQWLKKMAQRINGSDDILSGDILNIFRLIYEYDKLTKSDIYKLTGISRKKIDDVINVLYGACLIDKTYKQRSVVYNINEYGLKIIDYIKSNN